MSAREFMIYILDGKITDRKLVNEKFRLKDGAYLVSIKSRKQRSLPQNAYYWSVMVPMVKMALYDLGWDDIRTFQDAHEEIKKRFLKKGSTRKLTTVEFGELVEAVQKWGAQDLSIDIPSPNEQTIMLSEYLPEINESLTEDPNQ